MIWLVQSMNVHVDRRGVYKLQQIDNIAYYTDLSIKCYTYKI